MSKLADIRQRRIQLVGRAAVERERLRLHLAALEVPGALLDRGMWAVRSLRAHPEWAFAAVTLLVVLRPRRALVWASRGISAWRLWRWCSSRLREFAGGLP